MTALAKTAKTFVVVGGYDTIRLIELVKARNECAHIPTQRNRKVLRYIDRKIYKHCNLVERFFCKVQHFRRIATRFDKLATNFLVVVILASIHL